MLQFFRKYERSFLLIVFVPTIIGLGVTGTIAAVLGGGPDQGAPHKLFENATVWAGQIANSKYDLDRFHQILGGLTRDQQTTDDQAFDFLAKLHVANQAGIQVTSQELKEELKNAWTRKFAQLEAFRKLSQLPESELSNRQAYERKFYEFYAQGLGDATMEWHGQAIDRYRDSIKQSGFSTQRYEALYRDVLLTEKLVAFIEQSARVTAADLRKKLEEREHLRRVEYLEFSADDYRPREQDATKEALITFHEENGSWFEQPRSALIEYIAVGVPDLADKVAAPSEEAIRKHYDENPDLYREPKPEDTQPSGTGPVAGGPLAAGAAANPPEAPPQPVRPYDDVSEQIKGKLWQQSVDSELARLGAAMADVSADADFKAIAEQIGVRQELTDRVDGTAAILLHGGFGKTSTEVGRWFRDATEAGTSGLLSTMGGPLVVARLIEVIPPTVPPFEEISDDVRDAFMRGHVDELTDYYNNNQFRFRREAQYDVEYIFLPHEPLAAKAEESSEERLRRYYDDYPDEFREETESEGADEHAGHDHGENADDEKPPLRPFDEVREEIRERLRNEDATTRAAEIAEALRSAALKSYRKTNSVPELQVDISAADQFRDYRKLFQGDLVRGITEEQLREHEVLAAFSFIQELPELVGNNTPVSRTHQNDERTGHFVATIHAHEPTRTLSFSEAKDEVRQRVLSARGWTGALKRARHLTDQLAGGTSVEVTLTEAAKHSDIALPDLVVSPFFKRSDESVEGLAGWTAIKYQLFALPDSGAWADPIEDTEGNRIFVTHITERRAPSNKRLEDERKALRREILNTAKGEVKNEWELDLRLRARGLFRDQHVNEAFEIHHGSEGRAGVHLVDMLFTPDADTLEAEASRIARLRIDAIAARLKKGASFEDLARKYSEGPSSIKGGDLGWFGRGAMLKPFEETAFSLDVGQVSDPIKTSYGWHLIELLELGTGENAAKIHARHILMSSSLEKRKLNKAVEEQAWAIAQDHAEKALARLEAGEAFRSVARDMSDAPGSERSGGVSAGEINWPTAHELAILDGQPAGLKAKVSEPSGVSLYWTTVHRMEVPAFPGQPRPITKVHRAVDRAFFSAKKHGGQEGADKAAEDFRDEFSRREKLLNLNDPVSPALRDEFRKLARERSDAPSASHGGAVGLFREPEEMKRQGIEWLKRLGGLRPGERTEPFRSQDGIHILLLERVETASFDEAWEKAAEDLLITTSFDRRVSE